MIKAVLFDFHSTLVDGGDPERWIAEAIRPLGRMAGPGDDRTKELADYLDHVWVHAHDVDPASERDLSPDRHRSVFERTMARFPGGLTAELVDALYATMTDQWTAFDDAATVLRSLRERGVRTSVLSNVGIDIRGCLARNGLADLVDDVVLSYEAGVVKPDPAIFALALDRLGVDAADALMVGDSALADTGGTPLGLRTLVLPRTRGPVHGLDIVLGMVA